MSEWMTNAAPTHKCTICGALWRYFPQRDTGHEDSWSLRSSTCNPCCDMAPMGKQIVPTTNEDMLNWIKALLAIDAMTQAIHGPKEDENRH